MRFALKDYQTEAIGQILTHLSDAKDDVRRKNRLIAFALSATTGAGKTVMATAAFEALFLGSEDFGFEADPSAVVLWVTDDPSLNEQTRYRIIECGDRLDVSRLNIIGDGFEMEQFAAGNVYFLNIQKLGAKTTFVRHSDERTHTLWDTIRNTIEDDNLTLYLVLDEAHRGMRSANGSRAADERGRSTIVQRLINGNPDTGMPPVPIVWGISATVQRFSDAMNAAHSEGRITYPAVQVDPRAVQESGLLKDTIILDFPDETGAFETTFLRSALREMRDQSALWAEYAKQEGLPEPVLPLMVLQVPNTPSQSDLSRLLGVVHEVWPELDSEGVANVFGDHSDLTIGQDIVRYIPPQHVQDATDVRILLAKDAVSTGWDCPRAEVLFSLRPARDRTHITQLLGRMVRTPLARRIESDERLNSVSCFLPLFDQATAIDVANVLTGVKVDQDDPSSGAERGMGRKALTSPVTMLWNPEVPAEVQQVLASLPSEAIPKGDSKPIKRLLGLAAAISLDALMVGPDRRAHDALFSVLDGQMAQHVYAVEQRVEDIYTAEVRRITSRVAEASLSETTRQERADDRTVDDAYRTVTRTIGAAVANKYTKRLAEQADDDDFDFHAAKARVAALLSIPDVIVTVETEADKLANRWLDTLRVSIKGLGDERRSVYDDFRRQARDPQPVEIVVPKSRIENTRDADDQPLPTRSRHLLADENGRFPISKLNPWELSVVDTELQREETIGWYRNPSRPAADALRVPYRMGDIWKPMQPDFIFFSTDHHGKLRASIVDPHGDHLADAMPKLQGLARFAEKYGKDFLRIDAVSKVGDELRVLDLKVAAVRDAVDAATTASDLYQGGHAAPYV